MTPEAMRRLADLQLEKQFGIRTGDSKPREMAAPSLRWHSRRAARQANPAATAAGAGLRESDADFERRTTARGRDPCGATPPRLSAMRAGADPTGPLEAIALYDRLLTEYPNYEHKDKVLYQKARAYDELGRTEEAIETMERLIAREPAFRALRRSAVQAGRVLLHAPDASATPRPPIRRSSAWAPASSYYELALYKLGWTFYKQEFYEEALHKYMALLDYKVSIGYDFDQTHEEDDERRVADTFRVISLSFSNLGGPDAVQEYFSNFGNRSYEDRVYSNLGEHYLASCATTTRRRPTRLSWRSIRSTAPRRVSACASSILSRRAGSPSSCWSRSGISRPSTDCRPNTGDTSNPKSHRRCWPT